MSNKKLLEEHLRGWLPKESRIAYAHKPLKARWKSYFRILFIVVVLIVLSGVSFVCVRTYVRYSNPASDISASYFEKTVNDTTVEVGDVVEVEVSVYWHGYLIPEFKREVRIVDPFPEGNFILIDESNVYESSGYGGSHQFSYLLKVVKEEAISIELPKPRLYLDNVGINLVGTSPSLKVQISKSQS